MEDKLEIHCPCCQTLIVVERTTGAILFHKEPIRKSGLSFEEMVSDIAVKKSEAAKKFERELESQKDRSRLLDAKFKEALERAKKDD